MLKALITDIDGTITDPARRVHTGAIETIRSLVDRGIIVVLASGNTSCFMEAFCKAIGTSGSFIAENGGIYQAGFNGTPRISGHQAEVREALGIVQEYYRARGKELDLYHPTYRFADLAFGRTVPAAEVREILRDRPVQVIDTGFAIHIQSLGVDKGTAFLLLAQELGIPPEEFLAIGDSINDMPMLRQAGVGVAVANAHPETKAVAAYVTEKGYGDGFVEGIKKYF